MTVAPGPSHGAERGLADHRGPHVIKERLARRMWFLIRDPYTGGEHNAAGCIRLVVAHTVGVVTVTVRSAQPRELSEAGLLVARAYIDDELLRPDDPYLAVLQDAAGRARDSAVLVAVHEGMLLGTVTWCPPSSSHRDIAAIGEGEFKSLGVAAASRGRGVGELLVRECIERGRTQQLSAITISTPPSIGAAHRLYERLGFTRAPDKDWSPVRDFRLLAYRLDLRRSNR